MLERARWTVFRVHSRAFYRDPESAFRHVLEYFAPEEELGGEVETTVGVGDVRDTRPATAEVVESPVFAFERESIDPANIPLHEIQEALRSVTPGPGVEVLRDELFRRALPQLRLRRLGKRVRDRFQSGVNGLIRREEFGYRGLHVVWRLRTTDVDAADQGIPVSPPTSQDITTREVLASNTQLGQKAAMAEEFRERPDEFFQPLTYTEMREHNPSLPPAIYKCSYCSFYIPSDDPTNPTSAICSHIEANHKGKHLLFSVILDVDEIRGKVLTSLPRIFKCNFCAFQVVEPAQNDMIRHLNENHGNGMDT